MKYTFFGLYVVLCSLLALIFSSIISMILGLDLKIIFALENKKFLEFMSVCVMLYLIIYFALLLYTKIIVERKINAQIFKIHILWILFFIFHAVIFIILQAIGNNVLKDGFALKFALLLSFILGFILTKALYKFGEAKIEKYRELLREFEKKN